MAGEQQSLPVTRIRPARRWPGPEVASLWRGREIAYRLVRRDIIVRYRQTLLGASWVLLQPLLAAGAFTLVFDTVAQIPGPEGVPYFLLAYWGSVAYTTFAQTLSRTSLALLGNAPLVEKVYFPRLLLPLSVTGSVLLDTAVASALGLFLTLSAGVVPGPSLVLLPVVLLLLVLLGLGGGLVFAPLVVRYRDVGYVLPLVLQLLLYVSPVGYALAAAPEALQPVLLVNPLAPLIELLRWSVLSTAAPSAWPTALGVLVPAFAVVAGTAFFRREERVFADVI